jgi:hypothetical protein
MCLVLCLTTSSCTRPRRVTCLSTIAPPTTTVDCRADWLFTGGVAVGGPFVKRECFEWVLTSSTSVEYSAGAHLRQTVLAWRRMTIGERCYFKRDLYEYLLAMNSNAFNELTALLNGQRNVT